MTDHKHERVYNYQLMETVQELKTLSLDRWKQTDLNTNRLNLIEPILDNQVQMIKEHDIILKGRPDDRDDLGIIGVLRDIQQMIQSIKSWVKPVGISFLIFILTTAVAKILEVINTVELLTK